VDPFTGSRRRKVMKMELGTLGAALEREHHEIDEGIEGFSSERLADRERVQSLRRAIDALRRHIYLEEEFLFPPMEPDLAIPTMVMLREHGEIWRRLDAIEEKLGAVGSEDLLTASCRELCVLLAAHNGKEEPIFYGAADETLNAAESAELKELIDSGRMPEGWVCRQANESPPAQP